MVAPNDPSRPQRPVSARKRRANRRNAQQSTGPRTPEGKARAARNSTTHGIFCRDLVLAGEDPVHFAMIRDGFFDALRPQDAAQLALVDTAVCARWRLNRCQLAEATLIEKRIAAARAKVTDRFESLQRSMKFEDFSPAALHAQCEASALFRHHYEKWKKLRAAQTDAVQPGHALAGLMCHRDEQPLERLSRYEHRLEQTFHRCLRDLHVLKQRARQYADEPPSPFRSQWVVAADEENQPPHRGLGVPPEHSRAATESSPAEENELGRDAQATEEATEAATEEAGENPPVQNEPTAENSAASIGPAEGSDLSALHATSPDPQEMAELRKLTERLSRCRPSEDDDEYDDEVT